MIDSNRTATLSEAIHQFREYITQNHGSGSITAQAYIRIANDLERYASEKKLYSYPESAIKEYYALTVGVPPFEAPPSKSKERCARAIRMIRDILHHEEPKRRYVSHPLNCPASYQAILGRYETVMKDDQKSYGTIRTRSGRMKMFFVFLAERGCTALQDITPNFFSYNEFFEILTFDPLPFLSGIHSKKHERLPSFYTAEEVRRVLNAVDRSTLWGKTVYLMMLLACMYGLRSSDIKALDFADINWTSRTLTITQFKTHKAVSLPITDEILFALLDYIKNARPRVDNPKVFIRLKKPYIPYSMNDHFGDKIFPYFEAAEIDTKGKHHGLHSLRHSLATNLLEMGTPVNEIAVILGHSSAASTKAYVWSDIEHLRIAALEVPEK